ncbi:hypothetical protein VSR68_13175 [Paraburkholderia phymatum]|uniref:hypothetical protein n=1 Tax=Paraburkholderia phymatum TaxID=148447 RepID=UPI00317724BB
MVTEPNRFNAQTHVGRRANAAQQWFRFISDDENFSMATATPVATREDASDADTSLH